MKVLSQKTDVKKTLIRFGEISVLKSHQEGHQHRFAISPYMQELMTYADHLDSYCKSKEILKKFTSVEANPSHF